MADTNDITQLIEKDHREVERMFAQLLGGEAPDAGAVATQLCTELKVHTQCEEQVAYPAMRKAVPSGDQKIDEGIKEHDEAEKLIAQLEQLDVDDPAFESTLLELQAAVQHHVQEEESEILPPFRTFTSDDRRVELGRKWQEQKQATKQATKASVRGEAMSDLTDATKQELYDKAKEADIPGRSKMNKDELAQALSEQQQ
jgi:hemerythrin-like domain-containing protein